MNAANHLLFFMCFVFVPRTSSLPEECLLPFPRSYVSYSLKAHETIDVDGRIDEDAWKNVGWTEEFIGKLI